MHRQRLLDLYIRELSLQEPVANYTSRGINLYPQWLESSRMLVLGVGRFEELWAFGGVWGIFFLPHVLCTSEQ